MLTNYYDIDKLNSLDVDWVLLSLIILIVFFVSLQLLYYVLPYFYEWLESNE